MASINDLTAQKEQERKAREAKKESVRKAEQERKAAEKAKAEPPRDLLAETDALLAKAEKLSEQSAAEEAAFAKLSTDLAAIKEKIRAIHRDEHLSKVLKGPPGEARDEAQQLLDKLHKEKDRLLGAQNVDPAYRLVRVIFAASTYWELVGYCREACEEGFLGRLNPDQAHELASQGYSHLIVVGGRDEHGNEEIYFPRNTMDRQQCSIVRVLRFLKHQSMRNREQEERDMLKLLTAHAVRSGVNFVVAVHPEMQVEREMIFARFVRNMPAPNRTSHKMQRWTGVVVLKVTPTGEGQKVITVVKALGPLGSVLPRENESFRAFTGLRKPKHGEEIDLSDLQSNPPNKMPQVLFWWLMKYGADEEECGKPALLRWSHLLRREEAAREKKRAEKAAKPGPVVEKVGAPAGTNGSTAPATPASEAQPS